MNAKNLIFFFLIVFFTTISIVKFTKAVQTQIYYNPNNTAKPYTYGVNEYQTKSEAEAALMAAHPGAIAGSSTNHEDGGISYIYTYTTTPRPNGEN
uniref:SCP domain-containing protein n=1 Tax=Parastrongyloides trichosuri TaxID=131310 RepID=A0A0N4ZZU3_PARTI